MSAEGLKVERRDGIIILTLAHPPSNALMPGLRTGLLQVISAPGPTTRPFSTATTGTGQSATARHRSASVGSSASG